MNDHTKEPWLCDTRTVYALNEMMMQCLQIHICTRMKVTIATNLVEEFI